jgi:alanine racemase
MDMCMVDITDIETKENDEVIIFSDKYTVNEIAKELDTIPYEILTSISRRVKRVYYQE